MKRKVRRLLKLLFLTASINARFLIIRIKFPEFYPYIKAACKEQKRLIKMAATCKLPPIVKGDALDRLGEMVAVYREPGENDTAYGERIDARM